MLRKQILFFAVPLVLTAVLAGCRSQVVKINLINASDQPISTIIVDYPTATFGKDKLAPGETFSYAIKPLENGPLKVRFTDAQGASHIYESVPLKRNDDGWINIKLTQTSASTGFDITRKDN